MIMLDFFLSFFFFFFFCLISAGNLLLVLITTPQRMSIHNIFFCFYAEIEKIITKLSSNIP